MSDRKLAKAAQILLRQIGRLYRSLSKGVITWLLRTMLVVQRRHRPIAGFVLPTTVLLILVVALTAGAITYRAFTSSTRAISETQNRIIYNAATPAIDRARAKLEFLFDDKKDSRYPGGVPSENVLASMMLNDGATLVRGKSVARLLVGGQDAYTLAGETRIDVTGDGRVDNAWRYQDANTNSTVIYSINFLTPPDDAGANGKKGWQKLIEATDTTKADGVQSTVTGAQDGQEFPLVRNGPLSNANAVTCGRSTTGRTNVEGGWYEDATNTAILRKRFEVNALVVPNTAGNPGASSNFTTLSFAQDRQLDRGNKWGAWFRNDLEIFPGPPFQWNGAMHTEGSLILGNTAFSAYLISAPASCLFIESASEISVAQMDATPVTPANPSPPNNGNAFYGLFAAGRINNNAYGGSALIYPHRNNPIGNGINMTTGNDWATGSDPLGISLDPVAIVTRDGSVARNADPDNSSNLTANTTFQGRFLAKSETAPYVDDTYRADDRYGPKPKYKSNTTDDNGDGTPDGEIPSSGRVGDLIPNSNTLLVASTASGSDASQLGLDGYWERRARNQGLRILVGQRLELGNSYGWVTPQDRDGGKPPAVSGGGATPPANPAFVQAYSQPIPAASDSYTTLRNRNYGTGATAATADVDTSDNEGDPLYPPYGSSISHEARQRRALRDNPSAVQATAVYHAAVNRDYPIACLATTTHPGSPITLRQSINFVPTRFIDSTPAAAGGAGINSTATTGLLVDFFNGRGTNGWEFETPGLTQAGFEAAISNSGSSLRIALQNLANFAGDHISDTRTGAFPPTQEAGQIHPDPELTMWGNFSNLRRTLARLSSTSYADLSIADKTYLQTAGCTLGMLAYNVEQADKFDPRNWRNDSSSAMQTLALDLIRLMNGDVTDGEVLTKDRLSTYGYDISDTTPDPALFNPRDYDRVPAEAFLGALRERIIATGGSPNDPRIRLAELIYTHFQIRRDRTFGFRASPAANTWNYNPYVTDRPGNFETNLWSSACDPNIFALNTSTTARQAGPNSAAESTPGGDPTLNVMRLALSRLCGTVIPPGATREYPGDLNFPARSNNDPLVASNNDPTGAGKGTGKQFVPRNTATNRFESPDVYSGKVTTNWLSVFQQAGVATTAPYNDRPYVQATVAPKWPSLYYLFPNFAHDHDGNIERIGGASGACVDHRQPKGDLPPVNWTGCTETGGSSVIAAFQPWAEPYITDNYVTTANGSVTYQPVNQVAPPIADALLSPQAPPPAPAGFYPRPITFTATTTGNSISFNYQTFDTAPVAESSLSGVALAPRKLPGGFNNPLFLDANPTWQLPVAQLSSYSVTAQNTPPNRIMAPNGANVTGTVAVIPFLDRVLFNGREWLPTRVLDIDLGMLRRFRPANQVAGNGDNYAPNDVWLPVSGIVYAFREDATREDAIARPASGTATNATVPGSETDPAVTSTGTRGISTKPVDFIPDPERRPHGFRLRNGTQLKRHASMAIPDTDNVRGLSLFTDDPVYIMGNYNLHQTGTDDTVGTRLEEFQETLPDTAAYTEAQFYNRNTIDNRFADPTQDRWRPSEILADAISIVSDTFCDGSIMDGFMTAGQSSGTATLSTTTDPNQISPAVRGVYQSSTGDTGGGTVYNNQNNAALFGPGCTTNGITSFLNQNRPSTNPRPGGADYPRWFRENPTDKYTPIRVSRNGNGIIEQAPRSTTPPAATDTLFWQKPIRPAEYSAAYYDIQDDNTRPRQSAQDTRVNSIVISGSVPSRNQQSYGGLHNFPRFLETWTRLWFAGAFLQLNFSNYATAPFDADAWEPGQATTADEIINYYSPPNRLWGYDVALQLAPAGPAANRFVTPSKQRNEFYNEPAVSDPYMLRLCQAVRSNPPAGTNLANLRCPT